MYYLFSYLSMYIYIYIYVCILVLLIILLILLLPDRVAIVAFSEEAWQSKRLSEVAGHRMPDRVHPVRIARIHYPRFSPRVGLPTKIHLIGNLTAALRFSKGWVRKYRDLL